MKGFNLSACYAAKDCQMHSPSVHLYLSSAATAYYCSQCSLQVYSSIKADSSQTIMAPATKHRREFAKCYRSSTVSVGLIKALVVIDSGD